MADLQVDVCRRLGDADALLGPWAELHAGTGCPNPFVHPAWLIPWAERFVDDDAVRLVTVHRDDRLIAVAPLYVDSARRGVRVLRSLGTGRAEALVELPQILTGEDPRRALRAVVQWAWSEAGAFSWMELPVASGQGWLEPGWISDGQAHPGTVLHKSVRACVVAQLPPDEATWRAGLKRNVRESLRRARNRLDRTGLPWSIDVHEGAAVLAGLPPLLDLHAARAALPGKVHHPSHFQTPAAREFLHEAVAGLAAGPGAEVLVLLVDGEPAAARLVLRAPGAVYLAWSGVAPRWWELSGVTLLSAEAIQRAIRRGDTVANLASGPDTAKLRWSEELEVHHEFLVAGVGRRARAGFAVYLAARGLGELRRSTALAATAGAA